MSDKQKLLEAARRLPDGANWHDITEMMLQVLATAQRPADLAQLYRKQVTAKDLAEYLDPHTDISLDTVIAELKTSANSDQP